MTSSSSPPTSSTRSSRVEPRRSPRTWGAAPAVGALLVLAVACGAPQGDVATPSTHAVTPRQEWDLPVVASTTEPAAGVKRIVPLAALLEPAAGRTFADSTDAVVRSWVARLERDPVLAAATGDVSGLDLFDDQRILRSRVFFFLPRDPLGPGAAARLVDAVSEAPPGERRPARIGRIDGTLYRDRHGTCFLGVDDADVNGAVVWVVADDMDEVHAAIDAFRGAALAG